MAHQSHMILLLRQLSGLGTQLPDPYESPERSCVRTCIQMLRDVGPWESIRPTDFERGSIIIMWPYFVCSFTLLPLLDSDQSTRQPFITSCLKLRQYAKYWFAAVIILTGLKALAQQLGVVLPSATSSCFSGIEQMLPPRTEGDIAVTWVVPQHKELRQLLSDDDRGPERSSVELGILVARWNRMSLDG